MDELINRDNLKVFSFDCPSCESKDIMFRSLKYSNRQDLVGSEDLLEIDKQEGLRLGSLPTLKEAILKTDKEDLIFHCNNCNFTGRINGEFQKKDLRRWLKKKYGDGPINLGRRN